MPDYLLDANFFIQAHRVYYPMDVVPGFWNKLIELAAGGRIGSIDKVRAELFTNEDDLTEWCRNNLLKAFLMILRARSLRIGLLFNGQLISSSLPSLRWIILLVQMWPMPGWFLML